MMENDKFDMTHKLDIKTNLAQLRGLAEKGHLDADALEYALTVAGYVPDRAAWQRFTNVLLLLLGAAFTLSGIFFFFAYNWADMHHFLKFGLIEAAIVGAVIMAWQQGLDRLTGKTALLMAAMLVGALFAVFGQVYQTGADAYTLFLNWMLLISGWVIISAFPPLWLLWLALLNLTWGLYWGQVLDLEPSLFIETLFLLNGLALLGAELAHQRLKSWRNIRWIPRVIATLTIFCLTVPMLMFIFDMGASANDLYLRLAPVLYIAGIILAILAYYKIVPDLFILALCVLSIIAVITSAVGQTLDAMNIGSLSYIIISAVIILQAWIAVRLLRHVDDRWEDE